MNRKKSFWQTDACNLNYLSDKARRIFEESDFTALEDLFGDCNSIEEIEKAVDEIFQNRYIVRDAECGNQICSFYILDDAMEQIEKYEKEDKLDENYTPNFYEIYDIVSDMIV